jgi:predicted enzyme related to lactoylglutathione lyase
MEEEVERLVAAGASVVATHRDPEGFKDPFKWSVMQDPEGNEFCVATRMPHSG